MSTITVRKLKNVASARAEQHPFHLVDASPLPFLVSANVAVILCSLAFFMHHWPQDKALLLARLCYYDGQPSYWLLLNYTVSLLVLLFVWGLHITEEARAGFHTRKVQKGLKLGMVLFILSEVMFFFSFFWGLFHLGSMPAVTLGGVWPPLGIETLDPLGLPLLNTLILLASGVCTVYAHRAIIAGLKVDAMNGILGAIVYGLLFSYCQFVEYSLCNFAINDSAYGSVFFVATGFHGLHVIIGSILLWASYVRLVKDHFSRERHLGFEFAAWYWHFVDVVWIFLYTALYWWGSMRSGSSH